MSTTPVLDVVIDALALADPDSAAEFHEIKYCLNPGMVYHDALLGIDDANIRLPREVLDQLLNELQEVDEASVEFVAPIVAELRDRAA